VTLQSRGSKAKCNDPAPPHTYIYIYICILGKVVEVLEWRPSGRRKRGRPKLTWAEGISGMMGKKGLKEEVGADRNNWRRKIA